MHAPVNQDGDAYGATKGARLPHAGLAKEGTEGGEAAAGRSHPDGERGGAPAKTPKANSGIGGSGGGYRYLDTAGALGPNGLARKRVRQRR